MFNFYLQRVQKIRFEQTLYKTPCFLRRKSLISSISVSWNSVHFYVFCMCVDDYYVGFLAESNHFFELFLSHNSNFEPFYRQRCRLMVISPYLSYPTSPNSRHHPSLHRNPNSTPAQPIKVVAQQINMGRMNSGRRRGMAERDGGGGGGRQRRALAAGRVRSVQRVLNFSSQRGGSCPGGGSIEGRRRFQRRKTTINLRRAWKAAEQDWQRRETA